MTGRPRIEPRDEAHARRLETYRKSKAKQTAQLNSRKTLTESQLDAMLGIKGPDDRRAILLSISRSIRCTEP